MTGNITVITGPMRSRKSLELLILAQHYEIVGRKVQIFTPLGSAKDGSDSCKIETRFYEQAISTPAIGIPTNRPEVILEYVDHLIYNNSVVIIDECQFFNDRIIDVVRKLRASNHQVFIAGLDMDCFGMPFGPMPFLMAIANKVDKHTAICGICGNPATYSHRVRASDVQILVGDSDYTPVCEQHFNEFRNSYM